MSTLDQGTWRDARCLVHLRQKLAAETSAWNQKAGVTFASIPARGILNCIRSMARCEPRREAETFALMACNKVIGRSEERRVGQEGRYRGAVAVRWRGK